MTQASRPGPRRGKKKGMTKVELPPWRRVIVDVVDVAQDAVCSLLLDEGALGTEVVDDETRAIPGAAFTPTGRATVTATFETREGLELDVAARLSKVANAFEDIKDLSLQWEDVVEEDWNANFKAQWQPLKLGRRVWVVPSWREHPKEADDIVLDLDPGMAFGTGTHETTQLCMRALETFVETGVAAKMKVLDVGTGSGILALAAKKLGAGAVYGTDNDPHAVKIAGENAERNQTALHLSLDAPDPWGAVFDLVVANILAPTLIELAAPICGAIAPGGTLMLSGILAPQANDVIASYKAQGLAHVQTEQQGEWVRIDFRRA